MFKFVLCLSVAAAVAIPLHHEEEHHYAPKYSYKYAVKDGHTHDIKSHWENRDGDKVQGSYRLVEPDGAVRTVDYTADKHNGFKAVVTREKHGHREVTVHGKHEAASEEHSQHEQLKDGAFSGYTQGGYGAEYNSQVGLGYSGAEYNSEVGLGYAGAEYNSEVGAVAGYNGAGAGSGYYGAVGAGAGYEGGAAAGYGIQEHNYV